MQYLVLMRARRLEKRGTQPGPERTRLTGRAAEPARKRVTKLGSEEDRRKSEEERYEQD
jgi:hypothetical protein